MRHICATLCNIQLIKRPGLQVKVVGELQDHLVPALECGSQALTVTYQNYADHAQLLTKTVSQKNYLELVACCVPLL